MRARVPAASARLAAQVTALVQGLRRMDLEKAPGVSETLDWVSAFLAMDRASLDLESARDTIGVALKAREDVDAVLGERLAELVDTATRSAAG